MDAHSIVAHLLRGMDSDADAAAVAARTTSTWRAIDVALTPVIGKLGVSALYRRTIHVTAVSHLWLANAHARTEDAIDTRDLLTAMCEQDLPSAVAGATALIQNFCDLLASLVGPSLAGRLLGSVPAPSSSRTPAREATT